MSPNGLRRLFTQHIGGFFFGKSAPVFYTSRLRKNEEIKGDFCIQLQRTGFFLKILNLNLNILNTFNCSPFRLI
jgi:hypothetical protein